MAPSIVSVSPGAGVGSTWPQMRRSASAPLGAIVKAVNRAPKVSATTSVPSSVMTMPLGNQRSVGRLCSRGRRDRCGPALAVAGWPPPMRSKPKLPAYARPCRSTIMSLRCPVVSAETSVCSLTRAVGRASQHPPVLHGDDEQVAVGQPSKAGGLALDLEHGLLAAVGVVCEDSMAIEVRGPPATVVPARALEVGAAFGQRRQGSRSMLASSGRDGGRRGVHEHFELAADVGAARLEDDLGHAVRRRGRRAARGPGRPSRSSSPRRASGGRPPPRPPCPPR